MSSDPVLGLGRSHQSLFLYLRPGSSWANFVCMLQGLLHDPVGFGRGAMAQFCAVNLACLQYASGLQIRASARESFFGPVSQSLKHIFRPVPRIPPGPF